MQESEFTKLISDIIINFEKAGVKDNTLQSTIDRLFELKDIIFLRENIKKIMKDRPYCRTCKFNNENICKKLTYEINVNNEMQLPTIKINPFWSCAFYKSI